jgi:hypothetical protein
MTIAQAIPVVVAAAALPVAVHGRSFASMDTRMVAVRTAIAAVPRLLLPSTGALAGLRIRDLEDAFTAWCLR